MLCHNYMLASVFSFKLGKLLYCILKTHSTFRHKILSGKKNILCTLHLFFPNSQNTSAFVRVDGRLQRETQRVWQMLMSVTYPPSLVQPTLLFPATTLRVLSTVEPVLLVPFALH